MTLQGQGEGLNQFIIGKLNFKQPNNFMSNVSTSDVNKAAKLIAKGWILVASATTVNDKPKTFYVLSKPL